ncbi:MAG: hypothetical protein P8M30_02195 [Planctomycetaceae bacterium]|nr:hypothetical protein [bacterium]MDC0273575.1 hypothetical protein [Planctomycetaceae bacterium]MDG2388108.1 hypothetical protein [Planctomycetaceae bacterium]
MGESANITSVEAIANFQAGLRTQRDRASQVLDTYKREMHRVVQWFEGDLPLAWKQELQRRYEQMSEARTEYESCKLRTVAGQRSSCFDEKKKFERAKKRLQEGERKVENVKTWSRKYAEEAEECRGRLGKFQGVLDNDLEKSLALLERTIQSLENYLGRSVSPADSESTGAAHSNEKG